ncbi:MAG: carbonic anhydrase [Lysobacterales bacterium]
MIPPREALHRLRQGNREFVDGQAAPTPGDGLLGRSLRPADLVSQQQPFAIILGCSDARVPAEIIFNQGIGDLFVIQVAGNIVAPSQIGSIEFAAAQFGTRLVVVLGHSHCGAILGTLKELQRPSGQRSRNLGSIVNRVRPSVEVLLHTELRHDLDALVHHAVRANVSASVNQLRHGSPILEPLTESGDLVVVGAEYSLATGCVEFFDNPLDEAGSS